LRTFYEGHFLTNSLHFGAARLLFFFFFSQLNRKNRAYFLFYFNGSLGLPPSSHGHNRLRFPPCALMPASSGSSSPLSLNLDLGCSAAFFFSFSPFERRSARMVSLIAVGDFCPRAGPFLFPSSLGSSSASFPPLPFPRGLRGILFPFRRVKAPFPLTLVRFPSPLQQAHPPLPHAGPSPPPPKDHMVLFYPLERQHFLFVCFFC